MLGLITCFFNPTNSKTLKSNYLEFRKHLNHPIVTVELAFDKQPFFIDDAIQIRGSQKNIMWQKERLLNLALKSLPKNIDKVAWLDADIIFKNKNWFQETEDQLERYPVVQLFETSRELVETPDPVNHGVGFAKYLADNRGLKPWPRYWPTIGLAWAARKSVLSNGFFDKHILGTNDSLQFIAWLGLWNHNHVNCLNPYLRKDFLEWGWTIHQEVSKTLGYVSGEVIHLPHGSRVNRQYYRRDSVLVKHQFNPALDIIENSDGIYEWKSNKVLLQDEVKRYFQERKDDEINHKKGLF